MKVSMNGLRANLCGEVNNLRAQVQSILNDSYWEKEDLANALNDVICTVNTLNCVYSENDENFDDLGSDFDVQIIEGNS